MPRKYIIRSKEEKLAVIKEVLSWKSVRAWEPEIQHGGIRDWIKKYQSEGEAGLEQKKKQGNPLSRYRRRKELTYEEQLLCQIELLKRELLKKETEAARLKQRNARREGDTRKK